MKNGFGPGFLLAIIGRTWWLSVLLLLAAAVTVQAGDFTYTTNSDNTITITKYTGSGGAVAVPSSIHGRTVTVIGDYAFGSSSWFYGGSKATSVTAPDSVISIGYGAFANCAVLKRVIIGSGVTSIGDLAFDHCGVTSIEVDDENHKFSSKQGVLFNKNRTTLIQYPKAKTGSYIIPDSVTNIGDLAFWDCGDLTCVIIPDSVINIGKGAFDSCYGLTSVTMGNGVTCVEDGAFNHCKMLTSITISDSVASIGEKAFRACRSLPAIMIGNGVASIGNYAFDWCPELTGIYFKGIAPIIGSYVFGSGDKVIVYYLSGTAGWGPTFGSRPTEPWLIFLITANGQVGDVEVNRGYPLELALQTTNVGPYFGVPVDWWVIARAGSSWYYMNSSGQWTQFDGNLSHCHSANQGGLFDLPKTQVLNMPLPIGSYTFWFAVDYPMDGVLNLDGPMLVDSVNVTVQ